MPYTCKECGIMIVEFNEYGAKVNIEHQVVQHALSHRKYVNNRLDYLDVQFMTSTIRLY